MSQYVNEKINFFVSYGASNGSTLLMVTYYIQRSFQRHLTRPNPSSTKKLCHQQVGEENKSLSRFCRDIANDKASLRKNSDFVAIELVTNSVAKKPGFIDRASDKVFLRQNQILLQ